MDGADGGLAVHQPQWTFGHAQPVRGSDGLMQPADLASSSTSPASTHPFASSSAAHGGSYLPPSMLSEDHGAQHGQSYYLGGVAHPMGVTGNSDEASSMNGGHGYPPAASSSHRPPPPGPEHYVPDVGGSSSSAGNSPAPQPRHSVTNLLTGGSDSLSRSTSANSMSTSSQSTTTPVTVPVGRTRCYWAILSATTYQFLFVDPILHSHLGTQCRQFLDSSVLDFVHPGDREALENVLLSGPSGPSTSGQEETRAGGVLGTTTRVRYVRLSQIRKQLGAQEPELIVPSDAHLFTLDDVYMPLRIVTSWIDAPYGNSREGDPGVILAFFHATMDKDASEDNEEANPSDWTNFCGPRVEDSPHLEGLRCQQLAETLNKAIRPVPVTGVAPATIFQILNHDGDIVFTYPDPLHDWQEGKAYEEDDYAKLARDVTQRPRKKNEALSSCMKRLRGKHPTAGRSGMPPNVESVLIVYRAITFACFRTTGPALTLRTAGGGAGSPAPPAGTRIGGNEYDEQGSLGGGRPRKRSSTSSRRSSASANLLPPGPLGSYAAQQSAYPDPQQQQYHLRPGAISHHAPSSMDSASMSPYGDYGPSLHPPPPDLPERHLAVTMPKYFSSSPGGDVSPTVASASAILGSLTQRGASPFRQQRANSGTDYPPSESEVTHRSNWPFSSTAPVGAPPVHRYSYPGASYQPHPLAQAPQFASYGPAVEYNPSEPYVTASQQQAVQLHREPPGRLSLPSTSISSGGGIFPANTAEGAQTFPGSLQPGTARPSVYQPYRGNGDLVFDERYRPTVADLMPPVSSTQQTAMQYHPPQESLSPDEDSFGGDGPAQKKSRRGRSDGGLPILKTGVKACESCKSTESPEWRKGPSGTKSLCNACGLRYARTLAKAARLQEKAGKAKAAAAASMGGGESPLAFQPPGKKQVKRSPKPVEDAFESDLPDEANFDQLEDTHRQGSMSSPYDPAMGSLPDATSGVSDMQQYPPSTHVSNAQLAYAIYDQSSRVQHPGHYSTAYYQQQPGVYTSQPYPQAVKYADNGPTDEPGMVHYNSGIAQYVQSTSPPMQGMPFHSAPGPSIPLVGSPGSTSGQSSIAMSAAMPYTSAAETAYQMPYWHVQPPQHEQRQGGGGSMQWQGYSQGA